MQADIPYFPVVFDRHGVRLVGRVYRQVEDLTIRQRAVVVTGSWLTVKEQMAHVYAQALAARGFTAVTFDFAGFGQSGGDLRQVEMPSRKIADIDAAVRYVSTLSFVYPDQIAYLGVCASAQYALAAIARGTPVAAFASVAGWFHDTASVAPFYGGLDGVESRLRVSDVALSSYLRTGTVLMVPAFETGNERAAMWMEDDYYARPDRGAVPEWTNAMAEMSWFHWLTFDSLSSASGVAVPSLFVHSDGCVLPDNLRAVRDAVTGPVETVWGEGGQTEFYDRPAQVTPAVDAVVAHLDKTLGDG